MSKSKPSKSKKSKSQFGRLNPPQGTIELFRSEKGDMYFSPPVGGELVRWLVYPTGERWLRDKGYATGSKITGSIVNSLRTQGLIYTLKPQTSYQERLARSMAADERRRERRLREEAKWQAILEKMRRRRLGATSKRTQAKPAKPANNQMQRRGFNWAETVGIDQRLGAIRRNVTTIHPDGKVEVSETAGATASNAPPNTRKSSTD